MYFFQGAGPEGEINEENMESSGQLKGAGVEVTTSTQDGKYSLEVKIVIKEEGRNERKLLFHNVEQLEIE